MMHIRVQGQHLLLPLNTHQRCTKYAVHGV